jgi:hypothetical protein
MQVGDRTTGELFVLLQHSRTERQCQPARLTEIPSARTLIISLIDTRQVIRPLQTGIIRRTQFGMVT